MPLEGTVSWALGDIWLLSILLNPMRSSEESPDKAIGMLVRYNGTRAPTRRNISLLPWVGIEMQSFSCSFKWWTVLVQSVTAIHHFLCISFLSPSKICHLLNSMTALYRPMYYDNIVGSVLPCGMFGVLTSVCDTIFSIVTKSHPFIVQPNCRCVDVWWQQRITNSNVKGPHKKYQRYRLVPVRWKSDSVLLYRYVN